MTNLFSEKFWEKLQYHLLLDELDVGDLIGLNKAKIIYYPLSPKRFTDVRKVFTQTTEEDAELLDYYTPYWNKGTTRWQKIAEVAKAVNARIKYVNDWSNYSSAEYWASPIEVHRAKKDDCDGYSVLLTYVLRRLGLSEYEVFTAVGNAIPICRKREYHAYTIVLDITKCKGFRFFPLEGSFYPNECMTRFLNKSKELKLSERYAIPDWITNDRLSFANTRWFRFIK